MSTIATKRKGSGLHLSVFAKCLWITAMTTIAVTLALSTSNYLAGKRLVIDGVIERGQAVNKELASSLGGALRFKNIAEIESQLESLFANDNGYLELALVVDATGAVVAQKSVLGEQASVETTEAAAAAAGRDIGNSFGSMGAVHQIGVGDDNTIVGAVATVWSAEKKLKALQGHTVINLAISWAVMAVLLGIGAYMLRMIVGTPLKMLERDVVSVSSGNYDIAINGIARADEFGRLSRSFQEMTNGLSVAKAAADEQRADQIAEQHINQSLRDGLQKLSAGDLTVRIRQDFPAKFAQIRDDFNATAETLGETIKAVIASASQIDRESRDIGRQSEDLSQRTENQAATLEQTAAALDQLTNLVKYVAQDARAAELIVKRTQTEAVGGGDIVREAVCAMAEIEKSSEQISTIITVIDDIAFQTNLLALNAGVEAARAGEAGRGFAVVASEVRALAQRSSDAAREIKTLISNSSEQVGRGVALVDKTGKALAGISERVIESTEMITKMASGAADQSDALAEINISVNDLDQNTQKNAAMVEQANTASRSLRQQSQKLSQIVGRFELESAKGGDSRKRAA